jgi:arylsulfatase A-like enzyme
MQRNILLITTDTHRVDALKCMGSSFAHSPCIDKLASEGVMFTQAHSVAPVCMPARCSKAHCVIICFHQPCNLSGYSLS